MYEDTLGILDFLPIKARDPRVANLLDHHVSHLLKCIDNQLYSSSLVHMHIIYMTFVYIQVQRIANSNLHAYRFSLIGFNREEKDLLKEPDYPLLLSVINEKTVFRFFRLIDVDDGTIAMVSEPVNSRNKHLHASEEIECETELQYSIILNKYLHNMNKLLTCCKTVIRESYLSLENFSRLNERGYTITGDDIEAGVLLPGYFSKNELTIAISGNRTKLSRSIRNSFLV